eukprot:3294919-Pyramimonas_sp.AAC.1
MARASAESAHQGCKHVPCRGQAVRKFSSEEARAGPPGQLNCGRRAATSPSRALRPFPPDAHACARFLQNISKQIGACAVENLSDYAAEDGLLLLSADNDDVPPDPAPPRICARALEEDAANPLLG